MGQEHLCAGHNGMNREFFSKSQGIAVEAQHMHSDGEIEVAVSQHPAKQF